MADMTTMPVGQDWGTIITQLLSGGASLYDALGHGGTTDMGVAKTAAGLADPFASQRPQYQEQLAALLKDPSSIRNDPGYQFGMTQGLDAEKGASNAIYQSNRAGALAPELAKFATGYADNALNNRISQLMALSGVNAGSPGTAGLLYEKGGENQNSSTGSGINSLLTGLLGNGAANSAGGLIGLLGKILNPGGGGGGGGYSGSGNPGDAYPNASGGSATTPFTSLVGDGGGFNWDNIFGNTGNTGGGGDNWDALFGGGGYGGDFSNVNWDALFGSGG